MKSLFTICSSALFLLVLNANATVYTVSNVATRPAQFTSIQAAVDSAAIGDTILITGGGAAYNGISTVKPLVFIGEGINGTVANAGSLTLNRLNSSLSSSGSKFFGLQFSNVNIDPNFSGAQAGQRIIDNILFERCWLVGATSAYAASGVVKDITYRNCVFTGQIAYFYGAPWSSVNENFLYINCVFSGGGFDGNNNFNGTLIVRNSIFMNRSSSVFTTTIVGAVLENNIFYKAEPTGCTECTYNNNLTYLCNDNNLPPTSGNNVGSGNIVSVNPNFVSYPQLGASFSFAHNYGLQAGSPAIGSGTNSTNIGLTGGSAPVNNIPQFPKIPAVTQIDIPVSSVPVGGTLQINLRAVTRD